MAAVKTVQAQALRGASASAASQEPLENALSIIKGGVEPQLLECDEPVESYDLVGNERVSRGLLRGVKKFKTKLIGIPLQFLSAAGVGLTINQTYTLNAAAFPELTNFGAVFDEMRVTNVHCHYQLYCNASAAAPAVTYGSLAIVFDSSVSNVTTSYGCMESEFSSPLLTCWSSIASNAGLDRQKLMRLTATPKAQAVVGTNSPGASWVPIVSTPILYTFLAFIAPMGGTGVSAILAHMVLDVEFRVRL